MCGEHFLPTSKLRLSHGSSPRVWGALWCPACKMTWGRLIPTCVGSTPVAVERIEACSAHPHVCGEHCLRSVAIRCVTGSSPRVWGALKATFAGHLQRRLIPTCVGSTYRGGVNESDITAHPHVCGEHRYRAPFTSSRDGSSPRVWGARKRLFRRAPEFRLIPTCVGSTRLFSRLHIARAAHPHVCGEHAGSRQASKSVDGSSPRVWGALAPALPTLTRYRLIPTCVGSTGHPA